MLIKCLIYNVSLSKFSIEISCRTSNLLLNTKAVSSFTRKISAGKEKKTYRLRIFPKVFKKLCNLYWRVRGEKSDECAPIKFLAKCFLGGG